MVDFMVTYHLWNHLCIKNKKGKVVYNIVYISVFLTLISTNNILILSTCPGVPRLYHDAESKTDVRPSAASSRLLCPHSLRRGLEGEHDGWLSWS